VTLTTKELIEEVISLPVEDRVLLADVLLDSLNPTDPEIDREWEAVIDRRLEELRSGSVHSIPGSEVFARIWNRFQA
jgi:putative addiction module component (TIGR02574 family)